MNAVIFVAVVLIVVGAVVAYNNHRRIGKYLTTADHPTASAPFTTKLLNLAVGQVASVEYNGSQNGMTLGQQGSDGAVVKLISKQYIAPRVWVASYVRVK